MYTQTRCVPLATQIIPITASIVTLHSLMVTKAITAGITDSMSSLLIKNEAAAANMYIAIADSAPAAVTDMGTIGAGEAMVFVYDYGDLRKIYVAGEGAQSISVWPESA